MNIVLASQSPSRKKLLTKAGFVFTVFAPHIPEERFIDLKKPTHSCLQIAQQKALKAKPLYKKRIIIACDQMVYFKGRLFGKAYTAEKAIKTLSYLQGKTHSLISGLCMLFGDKKHLYSCRSRMSMRPLSQKQIKAYVSAEKTLLCRRKLSH